MPPLRPLLLLPPLAVALPLAAQTPAFPGALGFGAAATGGRGGSVYHVTNLNDSGAGSFRDAVSTAGRTVVFDVGGYITLTTECGVKSNITIAGQTAPGDGIAIRGAEVTFGNQSNIICRFVRFRPGGDSNDTDNGLSLYQARNVIVDHCSVGFAKWNNIDAVSEDWQNRPVKDISVTNCIIANPIGQQFGAHTECVEGTWFWLGNIFSSGHNRQPLAKIHTVFINNTIYNYSAAYTTHTSTSFKHDIVNNYFIGGPASAGTDNTWFQVDKNQSIYYSGNFKDRDRDTLLDGAVTTPYWYQGTGTVLSAPWSSITATVPTLTAAQAVVRNNCEAGALPHDDLDALVISQVKTLGSATTGSGAGTSGPGGGLYTSQTQTGLADGGYGTINGGNSPVDSDRDGMPDDWEAVKGLNPANGNDGKTILASGYSNLEEYLNWLALPHAFVAKNTAAQPTSVTLDLLPYLKGFPAGTPATLSNITGGTASYANGIVTFTPTANTSGLGAFTFSASGGGYTLTKTAGILISLNPPPRSLRWKGDGTANAWNTSAANWTNAAGGAAAVFANGDRVTLDDTGSNTPAITLTGTLAPGYMEKSSGIRPYTIGGTGSLSGAMALTVSGAPLTLQNSSANAYSGGTTIEDALLTLGGAATPGSGPITFLGNATLTSAYTASNTLSLNGNLLKVESGDAATVNCSARTVLGGATGNGVITINARGTVAGTSGNYLNGVWSGFSGTLNIRGAVPGAQCDLNLNGGSFDNFGNAELNLDAVKMQSRHYSSGNTIAIGALNGTATATLGGSSYAGGCTYEIGARGEACVFNGAVTDGVAPTTVTKVGGGTLELAGEHSYTGATNVTAGTLYAHGAFPGLLNINGGSLSPRSATVIGTIQANGGLTLQDCTLSMDLAPLPSPDSDRVTCPQGTTLSLKGTELTFRIKFAEGFLTPGTYPLVDGSATLVRDSGIVLSVTSPLPAGARQTLQVVRNSSTTPVPAYVNLVVTGSLADLIWTGTAGSVWDTNTTQNWTGAAGGTFYPYDTAIFDDSATTRTVSLTGSLLPRMVKLQHDTAYTLTGGGTLDGTARIEKSGTGTTTLSATGVSTFTGGTVISAGEILIDTASSAPLGTGAVTLSGGTLNLGTARSLPNSIFVNGSGLIKSVSGNVSPVSNPANSLSGSGTLSFAIPSGLCTIQGPMSGFSGTIQLGTSNGTLRLNGSSNANFGSAGAHFQLGTGTARLANRNGGITVELGAVSGGPNTTLQGRESSSGATASNYLIGGRNEDATFSGRIVTGGDASLNITKVGTGTWTLGGTSSYTGDFTVQSGRVAVKGALTLSGDITLRSGTVLSVDAGSVTAATIEIESGATLELCGTLTAASIVNHGMLRITCPGQSTLNGSIENSGRIFAAAGSRIQFNGDLENTGVIDLIGSPATLLPAATVNTGTILDSSLLKIQNVVRNGTAISLSLQTYADHTYVLQTASAPGGPWGQATGAITVQTSPAGLRTWTVFGTPDGKTFYRVSVGP